MRAEPRVVKQYLYKLTYIGTNRFMGRKSSTGSRLGITGQLREDLTDFCDAHRGAPENRIIQDALRAFIDERLGAEPELRKRFDEARQKRVGTAEAVVQLVPKKADC